MSYYGPGTLEGHHHHVDRLELSNLLRVILPRLLGLELFEYTYPLVPNHSHTRAAFNSGDTLKTLLSVAAAPFRFISVFTPTPRTTGKGLYAQGRVLGAKGRV